MHDNTHKKSLSTFLLAIFALLGLVFNFFTALPAVEAEAQGELPAHFEKLQLIVNQRTWNGDSWSNPSFYPTENTWAEWDCNNSFFNDLYMLGIADYEDGIAREAQTILNDSFRTNFYLLGGNRACLDYNKNAGNISSNYCHGNSTSEYVLNQPEDVLSYFPINVPAVECNSVENTFTPANNLVYAYQYRYNYTFPTDQKEQLSEAYRSKTGLDGTYDGIAWTYTYYTYFDSRTNSYISWENPNKGNANGGFLIHGMTEAMDQSTDLVLPVERVVSNVGNSVRFSCSTSEADIPSDVARVSVGSSAYYGGYHQASSNNQNPVIAKFTNGNQDWCNDKYDGGRPPDSKTRGLMVTPNGDLYAAFSVDGGDNNFEFGTRGGWLNSYGSGGGSTVSVVSKIDPQTGKATNGTFVRAQLTNGRTNSARIVGLNWDQASSQVVVEVNSAFSPLRTDKSKMDCGSYNSDGVHPYRLVFNADLSQAVSATSDTCN
jgi:hypothetical protein